MNAYKTNFFATCPNNRIRIEYTLVVATRKVVMVEDIIREVSAITEGFHEDIADSLQLALGGLQVLTAHHHGVTIRTTRGAA